MDLFDYESDVHVQVFLDLADAWVVLMVRVVGVALGLFMDFGIVETLHVIFVMFTYFHY